MTAVRCRLVVARRKTVILLVSLSVMANNIILSIDIVQILVYRKTNDIDTVPNSLMKSVKKGYLNIEELQMTFFFACVIIRLQGPYTT